MTMLKVIASSLNLRTAPSTSAPILKTIPTGARLTLVEAGDWKFVQDEASGIKGWVHKNYVTEITGEQKKKPAWRVAESLNVLRRQIDLIAPRRKKGFDGTIGDEAHQQHKSEHNPDENGIVRAIDITNDPASGCDAGKLAEALRANGDRRVKYVIWNHRITSRDKSGWLSYDGPNPHDHHFHLSVVSDPALYDDPTPWKLW